MRRIEYNLISKLKIVVNLRAPPNYANRVAGIWSQVCGAAIGNKFSKLSQAKTLTNGRQQRNARIHHFVPLLTGKPIDTSLAYPSANKCLSLVSAVWVM